MLPSPPNRTKSTIFLTPSHRELITRSGKTVQKFFEDLLDFYLTYDVGSWKEGHLLRRQARYVFMRAEALDTICRALPDPHDPAKKLGERAKLRLLSIWDIDPRKERNRKKALGRLTRLGWGIFTAQSPDKIVVESPAISNESFLRGYVEGILCLQLKTLQATRDRMIFKIEKAPAK
jgi:hypothetical protein